MKILTLLFLVLLLAGCGDPRTKCIKDASRDLSVIQELIADTEATIARGYAIQTETRTVVYTDFCFGSHRYNRGSFQFCNRAQPVVSKKPVAVDLDEERRKLRSLRQKEEELRRRAALDVQKCELAHPNA
ncbi:MAG: hypothetical protein HKP40_06370 [Litoreibacter sp.]|nr:hypothetical protein [Litoreibacter sp.]